MKDRLGAGLSQVLGTELERYKGSNSLTTVKGRNNVLYGTDDRYTPPDIDNHIVNTPPTVDGVRDYLNYDDNSPEGKRLAKNIEASRREVNKVIAGRRRAEPVPEDALATSSTRPVGSSLEPTSGLVFISSKVVDLGVMDFSFAAVGAQ